MKKEATILAIVLAATSVVASQPKPASASANLSAANLMVEKPTFHWFGPVISRQGPSRAKVEHVDGISSQPWANAVGWHPGEQTYFDGVTHDAHFNLFWAGAEPPQ